VIVIKKIFGRKKIMNEIIVYWSCGEKEWLRASEPESVYKNLIKNTNIQNDKANMCPAFKSHMSNIFSLKSMYSYEFSRDPITKVVTTDLYDQKFFNKHVDIRSQDSELISFVHDLIFFTEDETLEMSAGMFPFMEDNNITKNCIIFPGKIDIGKWFRSFDFAFYFKNGINSFKIEEDEIYSYIKFHTNKKIIFKQFIMNDKLIKYSKDILDAKSSRKIKFRNLSNYYKMLKHKKYIIEEIKKNII
jgi:hypothetical protein